MTATENDKPSCVEQSAVSSTQDALKELLEKVEAGEAPEYSLFRRGHQLWDCFYNTVQTADAYSAYKGSMDAALSLMEAALPGWIVELHEDASEGGWRAILHHRRGHYPKGGMQSADDPIPARALLIAILNALIAEGGDHE